MDMGIFTKLSIGIATAFILSGCATMSEKECLTANWHDQGYRDGSRGWPASRVMDHSEACAGVGVVPDMGRYRKGHARGVLEYCTPANAVSEGRAGQPYRNVCPARLEGEFLLYYRQGQRAYEAQRRVDRLNQESSQLERELKKAKDADSRHRLRKELRDLDRRLERARDDLADQDRRIPYR